MFKFKSTKSISNQKRISQAKVPKKNNLEL